MKYLLIILTLISINSYSNEFKIKIHFKNISIKPIEIIDDGGSIEAPRFGG